MGKRENSSGSIIRRQRQSGIVYEVFSPAQYVVDENGVKTCQRELLGRFKKKAEARMALEEFVRHPTSKYNMTLSELYKDYSSFAFDNLSPQTVTGYKTAWEKIQKAPGNIPKKKIREITTSDLRSILSYYQKPRTVDGKEIKPLSMSYITKMKAMLTQLYRYAMENNIVDRNYAALVKISAPESSRPAKRAFTDAEFKILEEHYTEYDASKVMYALCYLGFRITEFLILTPADYDPQAHTLKGGLKTKAGRNRTVPVHPKIIPLVENWVAQGHDTIFAKSNGKAYDKDSFNRIWKTAREALGLSKELTPHSARHTCATRMSASGARPEDIQAVLGHEDYSMTANTYINQDVSALTKAVALMK